MATITYPRHEWEDHGKRRDFLAAIGAYGNPGVFSALESLEASLWLLSNGMISQTLFLLHHTIEVAMKGLLEEVHVLLTLDSLEYDLAKGLIRERMKAHRLTSHITRFANPDDYDPRRTCGFEEAFKRVRDMVTFPSISTRQVDQLNKHRNRIMHYGGRDEELFDYLESILTVALPLLEEFYANAYHLQIADYLFAPVARELSVARQYVELAKENSGLPRSRIMHPFTCRYQSKLVIGMAHILFDSEGDLRDTWEWQYELRERKRRELEMNGWDVVGERADTECVTCGAHYCIVAVSEPHYIDGEEVYDAVAVHCPSCGLFLDTTHRDLARLHYGPITKERIGSEAWEKEIPR
jgi:hypothetical protein